MNVLELSEQEIIRRNSLNEMRAMGIDPYPAAEYVTNAFSTDIKAEFKEDETQSLAGRYEQRRRRRDGNLIRNMLAGFAKSHIFAAQTN